MALRKEVLGQFVLTYPSWYALFCKRMNSHASWFAANDNYWRETEDREAKRGHGFSPSPCHGVIIGGVVFPNVAPAPARKPGSCHEEYPGGV